MIDRGIFAYTPYVNYRCVYGICADNNFYIIIIIIRYLLTEISVLFAVCELLSIITVHIDIIPV